MDNRYSFFFILFVPALVYLTRKNRQEAPLTEALEADAVRRWDHYVRTGVLPDVGPVEPVSDEPG